MADLDREDAEELSAGLADLDATDAADAAAEERELERELAAE